MRAILCSKDSNCKNSLEPGAGEAARRDQGIAEYYRPDLRSRDLGVIPELLVKCYTPEVLQQLYALREAYLSCVDHFDPEISQLLWLALTAILRSCSFVGTAQWQHVFPNKRKAKSLEPFMVFEQKDCRYGQRHMAACEI
ncbi:MAG: hypothetical protein U1F42_06175 [Candidatus Competibacteraceae bacterium]